jgi:predicted ATP-dependent endonuclease of OLD family
MIERHVLYVDNCRGFKDTYVPLADINFLVGENSSGKTSLLSLLKLMSEERLLIESQFLADDVDLGTFDDIVSAQAEDSSYFRIGMIRWDTEAKLPLALLITYDKHEGLPRDISVTCTYGNKEIAIRRVGKDFHFRTHEKAISVDTDIRRLFGTWINEHRQPSSLWCNSTFS